MSYACRLLLIAVTVIVSGTILFHDPTRAQPRPAASNVTRTTATPPWPHVIQTDQATVTVYQPQAIAWPNRSMLNARVAVAVSPAGGGDQVLGTLDLSFATTVDAAAGIVTLTDPKLTASRFPTLDTTQAATMEERARATLARLDQRTIPLDTMLHGLKDNHEAEPAPVRNDPPVILYSAKAASLVVFDGEPILTPISDTGLSFAVNTNWAVFSDGKAWYLLNGGRWFSAPAATGPWQTAASLPAAFNRLPADQNFATVKKAIPPRPTQGPVPAIIVSTKPAELIVTYGPPQFVPVPGTGLQAVKNASSALFLDPAKGQFYYLTSGRWFSASGLDGPWTFATDSLPPDFAFIDPRGDYGAVLASVPKTAQAQAAVLKAKLPVLGTLKRDGTTVTVTYAGGHPIFAPIPGTTIKYATNTSFQVLEIGGRFYLCHQGAWLVSASPMGPWALADSIPPAIRTIPPSSPLYPVTYVTVQSSSPTTVTYAYTSGYMMGFVSAGVLVYGTGYYYPPYVVPGPVPVYMPYPYSYAGGVYYNPANGAWARGGAVTGPYYGAQGGSYYNPTTGAYARGGSIYGPYGGAGAFSAYNPQTGSYARGSASWNQYGGTATASAYNAQTGRSATTNQNWNQYQRWGSSTVTTPTQTINTQSGSDSRGSAGSFQSSSGAQGAGVKTASGRTGAVQTSSGDVYAGHDGNVYRHTDDGWQTYNNGGWQSVQKPTPPNSGSSGSNTLASPQAQTRNTSASRPPTGGGSRSPMTETTPRPTMNQSSFQQLEQDRGARFAGQGGLMGRFGGGFGGRTSDSGGIGGERFGGERFGGHFHR